MLKIFVNLVFRNVERRCLFKSLFQTPHVYIFLSCSYQSQAIFNIRWTALPLKESGRSRRMRLDAPSAPERHPMRRVSSANPLYRFYIPYILLYVFIQLSVYKYTITSLFCQELSAKHPNLSLRGAWVLHAATKQSQDIFCDYPANPRRTPSFTPLCFFLFPPPILPENP
jgi:hypothetical protein